MAKKSRSKKKSKKSARVKTKAEKKTTPKRSKRVGDSYGEWLLSRRGTIDPDIDLEY